MYDQLLRAQSKIMVNYQTIQYNFFNLSFLCVFQYVRDILQFTVSLDHPEPDSRDAKAYELMNNVCVTFFLAWVKSVQNLTLFCRES